MKDTVHRRILTVLFVMLSFYNTVAQTIEKKLLRAGQKDEWYTFLAKAGKNNDSLKVFDIGKNIIHVSGQDFGYIATVKKYHNFHLTLWFKWGEKKYPPREKEKRDAGILYRADLYSGDKIWPRSIEFQIQEGDCGDFWMTDSTTIVYKGKVTQPQNWHREAKLTDAEKPHGNWNKAEVIVDKGKITHLLNGTIVNEGSNPSIGEGQIMIQSEGAELYYKDVSIQIL